MSASPSSIVAELLPAAAGEWEPVTGGASGAWVFHDPARRRYAKVVPSERVADLAAERDRTGWLDETDLPSASVLDWRETGLGAVLVTRAVPGVSASELDAASLRRAWPSIASVVRDLHHLAVDRCPFDRTLAQMMPLARATVAEDRVVTEFLPQELQRTPPRMVLDRVEAELATRVAQERAGLVVCHGDLTLPNVLVDSGTGRVTGLIDLGRLGAADPHGDLALLLSEARRTWADEAMARRAEREFAEIYGTEPDPELLDFYLRLDPLTW
ncbi:MAG TPA: aminoglycoside 3'-phosphotransferase [Nocardioides sp.]|uniref:aminoglycoside 3'-phosphotransferase n=1 Tax=Nocardioides sp. TaxID=35761 RepID=UPI002E3552C6|nr:aminoglycoside 3'-phosphotransferase [Nocardioides sp.]HEX5087338.1 aminoglycoside 3'-phosphotransferase [Nocardioides sp.]